jgi:hypothetical protein
VLATVKGTLFNLVRDCSKSTENVNVVIPDHMRWVVTMWHFDADALADYIGEKDFWMRAIAEKIFFTIYSKEWNNGKCGIRWDCKEEPDKTVKQSLEGKLNACSGLGTWAIWELLT